MSTLITILKNTLNSLQKQRMGEEVSNFLNQGQYNSAEKLIKKYNLMKENIPIRYCKHSSDLNEVTKEQNLNYILNKITFKYYSFSSN
jgi:hypothetical protein